MIDKKIYIISTGRTGTTLISNLIASECKVNISHQVTGSRLINIIGNVSLHCSVGNIFVDKFLMKLFGDGECPYSTSDPLRSVPLSIFLLKNKDYCNGRIIHLVRDPRDFVTSFMNWKRSSFKRTILHHFIPLWQPSPVLAGDVSIRERLKMSKFEHFCWIWNFKNRFFEESFSESDNYFRLKFEHLVSEGNINTVKSLFGFMEIELLDKNHFKIPKKKVNKSEKKYFPKWVDWTPSQAKVLDHWCGDLMKSMGYGNEKEWQELLAS